TIMPTTSLQRLYPAAHQRIEAFRMLAEREMAGLVDDVEQRAALVSRQHLVELDAVIDRRRSIIEAPYHLHRALQAPLVDPLQGLALLACELGSEELAAELLERHLAHALLILGQRELRHHRVDPLFGHYLRVEAVIFVDPAHAFARARGV